MVLSQNCQVKITCSEMPFYPPGQKWRDALRSDFLTFFVFSRPLAQPQVCSSSNNPAQCLRREEEEDSDEDAAADVAVDEDADVEADARRMFGCP